MNIVKERDRIVHHLLVAALPPHKSLFQAPEDKGLPVGNHTSQFFANVYLNELGQLRMTI